jgi:hypothetical protein
MPLSAADDLITPTSFSSLIKRAISTKYMRREKLMVGYFSPEMRRDALLKN